MQQSLKIDRHDIRKTEDQEKYAFIRNILKNIGLPIDAFYPTNISDFSINHKINLRKLLDKSDIEIINDGEGDVEIYTDGNQPTKRKLIARWNKCEFEYREDISSIVDPKKRLYAILHINYWSIFEKE